MRIVNYKYTNDTALKAFIKSENIAEAQTLLIQLFYSHRQEKELFALRDTLHTLLEQSKLIASSTAGIIGESSLEDDAIWISFSLFESSCVKVGSYQEEQSESALEDLLEELVSSQTKLLIIFANTYRYNSEIVLKKMTQKYPKLTVAGGNSGDDFGFKSAKVFTSESDDCALAFAAIDSEDLEVQSKYLFNWQAIGQGMIVTKASGDRVYEINHENIFAIYKKYLGADISENMLTYGIEFPLIVEQEGVEIARAVIDVNVQEGWAQFAGNIAQGSVVRFGYVNIENMQKQNIAILDQDADYSNEGVYIYTCAARRKVLGDYLDTEIDALRKIAPCSGFVSYGEFYHDQESGTNNLLNISTTYVVLNEHPKQKRRSIEDPPSLSKKEDIRLKALSNLVRRTSQDLEENIYYLEQFKKSVEEASIFSITDKEGIIIDVNKNFENISGYTKEELIGSSHNLVRHEDMPKEVFKEMWKTIKAGKIWRGMVKNKSKDAKPYYVISEITPIYNKDGSFKEYIGIRNDVTELEEYKNLLRHELDSTSENLEDNLYYTSQYEDAMNSITAVIKTDTEHKITYANKKFCDLSGYTQNELIGTDCAALRHQKHRDTHLCEQIMHKLAKRQTVNHVLTNIAKDGSEYITNTLFYPVLRRDGTVIEYLQIMHDVTEISLLNEEITNTQKEVVLTMGAIGETRSQETGLHVKRVAEYSYLLARLVGLSENEASLLKQASPMHDIGKVGIPDSILNKPGKLTSEEFEIMKSHAMIGYEMLKHSNRPILRASAQVALTHHEKYDGSGYPQGLKAEDIPIYGRITAIADVFDALGHDRCYKKAWELEQILELFQKESAKHFDPNLIELFFENLDKFLLIRDTFQD